MKCNDVMKTERIKTSLRLTPALVARLKIMARRNNKSLNRYVEEILEREVADEFPHLNREDFLKGDKFLKSGTTIPEITQEMIDKDPKLAHILGV